MSGLFADRLNPAYRTFHGYAGDEPIYCNETADVVVDQFEGDTGKVRIESGAGRARMTVGEAVAMAYAILRRFRPHTGVPPAELHRPAAGEPDNDVIAVFAHPHDHRPESVYQRSDETADESGYARDDDDQLTLQRWYEATEFPEAPSRWDDITEGHIGPIFVFRLPKPAPETTEQHQP